MACYRDGGCGPYEMFSCSECPASKPEYAKVKEYPPYLDYPKERKKQTNADKYFRNATDEELVAWLCDHVDCRYCPAEKTGCLDGDAACGDAWLEWLKQEVEE